MLNHIYSASEAKPSRPAALALPRLHWLVLPLGLLAGLVVSYLLASGEWYLALALILLMPGIVVLHRAPFAAVIIWLLLTPFLMHTTTGAERRVYWIIHRALPPLTLGIIWLSAALRVRRRRLPRLGVPELAMAGYLAFGVTSVMLQNGTPMATLFLFYDRVFSPMCLYLIIRLTLPGRREWLWLVPVLFFIVLSQSTVGVLSWVAPSVLPSKWLDKVGTRTTGTLINPSIYTTALVFAGLLMLHGACHMKKGWARTAIFAVFFLCLFAIFISFSRAAWLGGMLVLAGLVYLHPRLMLRFMLVGLALTVLLGGFLLPPYLDVARQRLYSSQAQGSALDRLPGFVAAYRMFQEKPLVGWGYGNFDVYDRQFTGRVLDFANDNKDHASHNWFLSMLAEQGAIGTLLFLGPVLWWLLASLKNGSRLPKEDMWNQKLLILLWLIVLFEFVTNNFMNMIIFFGHGLWWIVLGLVANLLAGRRLPAQASGWREKWAPVWMVRDATAVLDADRVR